MRKLVLVVLMFACSACDLVTYSDVVIELPDPPASWPAVLGDSGYIVRYLEAAGSVGEMRVGPGSRSALLRLPGLAVVPVSAAPLCGDPSGIVGSCGAVYPAGLGGGDTLHLRWENGFLAAVLLRCAGSGDALQAVNVAKLAPALMEKSGGNPWRLDGELLSAAILDGTLGYRSIRRLPCYEVTVAATPGRWISGNPLSPFVVECLDGTMVLPELPVGLHSYFRLGGQERLDISVETGGYTAINPVTGGGSSGKW